MVHIGGFFMGLKKTTESAIFYCTKLHILRTVHKEKTAEMTVFQRFS